MLQRRLLGYGVALLAGVVLVVVAGHFYWTKGVYVSVTNNTQGTLKQIEIVCTGGVVRIATLEPMASCTRYINPAGRSILRLGWVDSSGAKRSHGLDTYLDPNYSGIVKIAFEPGDRMSVTQKVRDGLMLRGPGKRTYSLQSDTNGIR